MPVITETFEGAPGGMNLALPANELDDSEAQYIQDGLVDYPGLCRRRGPLVDVPGIATLTKKASGLAMTLNPLGTDHYGYLGGDASNGYFVVLSDDLTTEQAALTWPHPLPTNPAGGAATAYRNVSVNPALNGGVWIGTSSAYDSNAPNQDLALWRGANRANYAATSVTVARSSAALTAPAGFTTHVVPGMFLFANTDEGYTSAYIGVVLTVNSDTSITLENPSPFAVTAKAGTFQALRGFSPKVVKGRITCDVSSTTVTGGATKFLSQGLGSGTWQLYRASDFAYVGKVSSVASDTSLTLTANAAVACADERYVALRADADFSIPTTASINKVGFVNSVYSGFQWYANNGSQYTKTSYVWFSDPSDPEAVDLSVFDGDWLEIASTSGINAPIKALCASYNALLVFKENETFAVYGSSPSQFTVKKLEDDGALSGMSVQPYAGGVVWAGREGIHFYDGIQAQNLTQAKLGDYWKNTMRTFDPSKYRMWSTVNRDHYLLFIENISPTVAVVKGEVSTTPSSYTIAINMATQAVTILTNLNFRGSVVLPASAGKKVWFIANDSSIGHLCDGEAIFNQEGTDSFACDGGTAGPDFYFESKKFDAGDSLRLKRYKQLAIHYIVQGGSINVDSVLGMNDTGQNILTTFVPTVYTWDKLATIGVATWDSLKNTFPTWSAIISAVFLPQRVKFYKKSQHFAFRLYQSTNTITRLRIGPYQIGYKMERAGRVT